MFYHIIKVSYLVVFYFLLSTFTSAQDNWTWLNPKPMGYTINGATVIPGTSTVIAVGAKGVILKSTDSGTSWTLLRSGYLQSLSSVSFPTSTVGYATGDAAVVIKTTDGGETWNTITSPGGSGNFTQVQFVSETGGFINEKQGPKIHKTTDGGLSWTTYLTSSHGNINSFEMKDADNGFYLANDGYIFKINAGIPSIVCTTSIAPLALDFYDNNTGIVVGSGVTFITSDGGNNWNSPFDGCPIIPNAVVYTGPSKVVAISSAEEIILSTNGGTNWSSIVAATSGLGLNSIVFLDQDNGLVLGTTGMTYTTTNGGSTWTRTTENTLPDFNQLNSMVTLDRTTIWAGGSAGKIIKSTDGGSSWASFSSPTTSTINSLEFTSPLRSYVLTSTTLYATTNGGSLWGTQLSTSAGSQEVVFSTLYRGYMCGTNGIVRYSTKGTDWAAPTTLPSGGYYSIATTPDTMIAYICGYSGTSSKIIKTANAGGVWINLDNAVFQGVTFYSINFPTATTGWVVGTGGNIFKTTDGGTSWNSQTSNTSASLQSVVFSDEDHGVAVGNSGVIIKTTNGGTTWTRSTDVTDQPLMSTLLLNEYTTIAVGQGGVILKSYNAPLPVELTAFTAAYRNGTVTLNWETKTEIDNYGFEIERKSSVSGWQKIGFVEGHFTTNSPKYYNFTDRPTGTGKIQYRLKQIDNDGTFEYSHIAEVFVGKMPNGYLLEQNYPNPFNPSTTIGFTTQTTGFVKLVVYNPLGETVKVLFSDIAEAGRYYKLEFDATGLNSGVYFYRLEAENFKTIKKLTLVK